MSKKIKVIVSSFYIQRFHYNVNIDKIFQSKNWYSTRKKWRKKKQIYHKRTKIVIQSKKCGYFKFGDQLNWDQISIPIYVCFCLLIFLCNRAIIFKFIFIIIMNFNNLLLILFHKKNLLLELELFIINIIL